MSAGDTSALTEFFLGVWLFFPETNGRHLEEVDQIFRDSRNVFDPVKMAKQLPTDVFLAEETGTVKRQTSEFVESKDGR